MKDHKLTKTASFFLDLLFLLLGSTIFAAGFQMFLLPHGVVLGGATGIATILNLFFGWPAGVLVLLVNLPLFAVSFFVYGKRGLGKAVLGTVALSVLIDLCTFFPTDLTADPLIASVFGGGITGLGMAIALLRGFTSGGSDLAAYLIHRRLRFLSFGTIVLLIDGVIIILSAILRGDLGGLFYSIVSIATYSIVLDGVVGRSYRARLALVICPLDAEEELVAAVKAKIERGITVFKAKGTHTGEKRCVMLCAMYPRETALFSSIVHRTCPSAFLIFLHAPVVFGSRFREESEDNPLLV